MSSKASRVIAHISILSLCERITDLRSALSYAVCHCSLASGVRFQPADTNMWESQSSDGCFLGVV